MGYNNIKDNHKSSWHSEQAEYSDDNLSLQIAGHPVMERWESPYMKEIADIASSNGGHVLEVGFGMGISAGYIQANDISRHTVIEANSSVFAKLEKFANSSSHTVNPLKGLWQNVVKNLDDESFDGILYDTYPLSQEDLHKHQFSFLKESFRLLKKGGVLSYCNLTSWGTLVPQYDNIDMFFEQTQKPHLVDIGYSSINYKTVEVNPPNDCKYYQSRLITAPIIKK